MTPKEIGRAAGRIFEKSVPPNCAIRSQEDQEDYGIDYELELTDANDQATGLIFKVQQKGVETASLGGDGKWVSFSTLTVEKMAYYLNKVRIPVIFVVVDVATESVWWTRLQGNEEVEQAYREAVAAKQETMTIRLRTSDSLPTTFPNLLAAVSEAQYAIITAVLRAANGTQLLEAAASSAHFGNTAAAIALQNDIFRSEQIERLIQEGNAAAAFRTAQVHFNSESESISMRFSAAMNMVRLFPATQTNRDDPQRIERVVAQRLQVTEQLHKLTHQVETHKNLRLYALFLRRAARLRFFVQQDMGLHMTLRVQSETGDALTISMTNAAQMSMATKVTQEFRKTQTCFLRLIRQGALHFTTPAWHQIASDISPFLIRLKEDGLNEALDQMVEWLDATYDFAVNVAKAAKDWSSIGLSAVANLQISGAFSKETEKYAQRKADARKTIEAIEDESIRTHWLSRFDDFVAALDAPHPARPSFADEEAIYRQMAKAMGINLEDENDQIASVINIGLRDRNPERVLKNCRQLRVKLGPSGIPAKMLGLPTAGFKSVHCVKFGFAAGALSLDAAYDLLVDEHCSKCTEAEPHPPTWKWDANWQQENSGKDLPDLF